MSEAPQGPGWWQASDGRWYPPHTHPSYQQPAAGSPGAPGPAGYGAPGYGAGPGAPGPGVPGHGTPGPGMPGYGMSPGKGYQPARPSGSGVPKGLIIAGVIVLVVVVAGYAAVSYVLGRVGDKLENAVGGDCTLVDKGEVDSVMSGEFDLIQLGGLTSIATPALDSRVLADGTTCWATETNTSEDQVRLVRIARLEGGDAKARFQQELTLAKGVKEDRGGGISVESQPYLNKEVSFGDEAFCTTTDFAGSSGVLVRRGDSLVYVSLTSGGIPQLDPNGVDPGGAIKFADDDAHCDLAQKLADKVG